MSQNNLYTTDKSDSSLYEIFQISLRGLALSGRLQSSA